MVVVAWGGGEGKVRRVLRRIPINNYDDDYDNNNYNNNNNNDK